MANLSISKAWDDSRPIIARDGRLMFSVALATVVLPGSVLMTIAPGETDLQMGGVTVDGGEAGAGVLVLSFLFSLINLIGSIAISYLALFRGASVAGALGRGVRRLGAVIGMVLLLLVPLALIVILFALLVVPGGEIGAIGEPQAMQGLSAGAAFGALFLLAALLYVGVRLMVITPVVAAEDVGPIGIVKRGWALTRGHFWRLFGFLLLFAIGVVLVMGTVGLIAGLAIELALGPVEPMTVAALLAALVSTLAQAAVTIVYSTILARIYLQLAGQPADPAVGVPPVSAEPPTP
ncbi:glycerophosphoryl diester phosphodiesterase membrane domain-containing protein [Sphingomicrobium astaxanthinifaciens]|uniref:glycerophosphoryl diester phosphodiesterase membrane domain-containing protein n=1 Tax=Sphingomicrobium astaxanthinifaciens TaxID=1227949 RepID=UPI001FCBFB03|nr:glycerophosphoryl diester phosphodiesterase membrane domain-containing protein [Sphingomicrobium astaxanthinifaciens]MCJ7422043.1 glycerophosphoryl diester phosphodiesterase membrane domain-containing protein [Sphingomicrobium astaxanthinifaciens]